MKSKRVLLLTTSALAGGSRFDVAQAFPSQQPQPLSFSLSRQRQKGSLLWATTATTTEESTTARRPCYYKTPEGQWRQRLELKELAIGQELHGHVVQELLEGKTGPKLFLDVGVGRYTNNNWNIQTAMLRLPRTKKSVVQKRAARLRKKTDIPVYVSRIRLPSAQLEVCLTPEEVEQYQTSKAPVSSLQVGQELTGTVMRVEDYGVLVDVGANRHGLLHIQKVADLYAHYIDKSKGLIEAGVERGAILKLQVTSNERKRLFLDFTDSVKEEAKEERERRRQERQERLQRSKDKETKTPQTAVVAQPPPASDSKSDPAEEGEEEDEDEYDEDREIEDALGLGTY